MTEPTYEQWETLDGKPIKTLSELEGLSSMDKPEIETLDYKPECKTCADTGTISREINDGISLESCPDCPEQPNQNIMIIKTIQSLMTVVNDNLGKLPDSSPLKTMALEEIDLFQRTTLNHLQEEFE